jgi:putative flippase GtrA
MTTEFADPPDAVAAHERTSRGPLGQVLDRFVPRHLQGQLVRFAVIGVASTVAYGLLFLLLRLVTGAFVANGFALLLTAIANTALNRRVTFGVRGNGGLAGDHAVGLLAFGAGLALTTGALAVLHTTGSSSKGLELVVLTVANAAATLLRFVALKLKIGR